MDYETLDRLLHKLWGLSVDTPTYNKRDWMDFQEQVEILKDRDRQSQPFTGVNLREFA